MAGLFIRFAAGRGGYGGVDQINGMIAKLLRRHFRIAQSPEDADVQVCSLNWEVPESPRRLFLDHGSFADAGFWARVAPRLRASDTIQVTSRVCRQVAERMFEEPGPALHLVPLCADTDLFCPAQDRVKRREELERSLSIPATAPLLLTVASYSRRKNIHLAIRFLNALRHRVKGTQLALVGSPGESARYQEYDRELRHLVQRLALGESVHFLGRLPHSRLRDLMTAADLLVHLTTCRLENFGLVVAEALASGLPVVAADWGGLRDLVTPGGTGILARTFLTRGGPRVDWLGSVGQAAAVLAHLDRWGEMSRVASEQARRHLSAAAFELRLLESVERALSGPAAGAAAAKLTRRAEDLMFRTIQIHRRHGPIRSTSQEYRLLLEADSELCRFMTAPAATAEHPPKLEMHHRLYPAVAFEVGPDAIQVTDPAWPGQRKVSAGSLALAASCDGSRPLADLLPELRSRVGSGDAVMAAAQELAEEGILCPVSPLP